MLKNISDDTLILLSVLIAIGIGLTGGWFFYYHVYGINFHSTNAAGLFLLTVFSAIYCMVALGVSFFMIAKAAQSSAFSLSRLIPWVLLVGGAAYVLLKK